MKDKIRQRFHDLSFFFLSDIPKKRATTADYYYTCRYNDTRVFWSPLPILLRRRANVQRAMSKVVREKISCYRYRYRYTKRRGECLVSPSLSLSFLGVPTVGGGASAVSIVFYALSLSFLPLPPYSLLLLLYEYQSLPYLSRYQLVRYKYDSSKYEYS